MAYFYHRAQNWGDWDGESGFCSPKPLGSHRRPHVGRRGGGGVRSADTTAAIVSQIHQIIEGKIADGQLDECP